VLSFFPIFNKKIMPDRLDCGGEPIPEGGESSGDLSAKAMVVEYDGTRVEFDSVQTLFTALRDNLDAETYERFLREVGLDPELVESIISTEEPWRWLDIPVCMKIMELFDIKMSKMAELFGVFPACTVPGRMETRLELDDVTVCSGVGGNEDNVRVVEDFPPTPLGRFFVFRLSMSVKDEMPHLSDCR